MDQTEETARLEAVTLESEISMSVATNDTAAFLPRRRSFLDRLRGGTLDDPDVARQKEYCCGFLNVEPVLVLISASAGLLVTSQQLFLYWARCVEIAGQLHPNISNTSALCASIADRNSTALQDRVETDIASTKIYLQIASSLPPLIVAPLVGTWSDRKGRKAPLIFTIFGFFIYSLFNLIGTLVYETTNVYYWIGAAEVSCGLFGGVASLFAAMLAIVTDDSRHKLKQGSSSVPMRIVVATAIQSIGGFMGSFVVSMLAVPALVNVSAHAYSYVKCASIVCMLVLSALVYAVVFVKETHNPNKEELAARYGGYVDRVDSQSTDTDVATREGGCSRTSGLLTEICEVLCERRPGWSRFCLNTAILFIFVEFLALDSSLLLLLVKRQPFAWSDTMFSDFNTLRTLFFALGMILVPLALTKVTILGKDSLMIIIGISFSAITFFMTAVASTTAEIFATAFISVMVGIISPGYRSFLPRLVTKEQTARLFTVISIVMSICPIASTAIFNSLFKWSIDWWPGFAFMIGGFCQLLAVMGQCLIHYLMFPQWKLERQLLEHRRRLGLQTDSDGPAIRPQVPVNGSDERSVSNTAVGSDINDDRDMLVT